MAWPKQHGGNKNWAKKYNRCQSAKCRGWNWAEDTRCYYCHTPLAITIPPIGYPPIVEWPKSKGGRAGQKDQQHPAGGATPTEGAGESGQIKFFEAQIATYRSQGIGDNDILITTCGERLEAAKNLLHSSKDPYKRAESGISKLQAKQRAKGKHQTALEELQEKQSEIEEKIAEEERTIGNIEDEISGLQDQIHKDRLEAALEEDGGANLNCFFGEDFNELDNSVDLQAQFDQFMANTKLAIKGVKNKRDEAFKKREQEEKDEQNKKPAAEAPAVPGAGDKDEPILSSDNMQEIIAKRLNEVSGELDKAAIAKLLAEDFDADVKRRRSDRSRARSRSPRK